VTSRPVADLLVTLAEPTRLRILNCLSTAPLFVSDLSAILDLPDATIVEHMDTLESLGIARTYPVVPYLIYTLAPQPGTRERLLRSVLDAVRSDPAAQADRTAALDRSRSRFETQVLAELRRRDETHDVGVLLLTARKDEPDRIKGLSLGADDYLAKPFSPKELVLRVGAILRRLAAPPVAAGGRLVGGPIVLDRTAHRVTADGKEVELTATEFKLLERLIERRDRVQSRSQLLESVWQAQPDIQTRTVDMHVQRLRSKLGAAGGWIETVRAVGYRFREPAASPKSPTPAARRRRT
jgi:DNA-binding response OmpR family regulator/DNA-binding transcriptional ArsR family regulator